MRQSSKFDDQKYSFEIVNRPSSLKRSKNNTPQYKNDKIRASAAMKKTAKKYDDLDSEMRKILEEDEEFNSPIDNRKHLPNTSRSG